MDPANPANQNTAVAQFPEVLNKYKSTLVDTLEGVSSFINNLVNLGMHDKQTLASWSSVATLRGCHSFPDFYDCEPRPTYKPKTFADLNRPHSIASLMPALYLDCEGVNLSRNGTLTILEIMSVLENHVYVFDVHVLGEKAFLTPGKDGVTLKDILEDPLIAKAFFDVRNDSDALHHHFNIKLQGIQDIQLMELAMREGRREYLYGLARCIDNVTDECRLSFTERRALQDVKSTGRTILQEEGYELFAERPLRPELMMYCIIDVALLPMLWTYYTLDITKKRWAIVLELSAARVSESQHEDYDPCGEDKAKAPGDFKYFVRRWPEWYKWPDGIRRVPDAMISPPRVQKCQAWWVPGW